MFFPEMSFFNTRPRWCAQDSYPVTLSIRYSGGNDFRLTAKQGANVWSASVTDPGVLLEGGYAGPAIQRGRTFAEIEGNWSNIRVDDFSIEPAVVGTTLLVR